MTGTAFNVFQDFGAGGLDLVVDSLTEIPDRSHGDLQDLVAPADDHTQYFLLAGRSGGQSAHGGINTNEILQLRGSIGGNEGFIDVYSPMRMVGSFLTMASQQYIQWAPVVAASGAAVTSLLYAAGDVNVTAGTFIYSAVREVSRFKQRAAPGFAVNTLFLAQPQWVADTAGIQPAQAFILAAQGQMRNEGAGNLSGSPIANHIGVSFSPTMACTTSGDQLVVTNHTGMQVQPLWSTVSGSTVNFGTIRGVYCLNPIKGLFFPGAGVETMTAYIGLDMANITFGGNVTKAAVRSAQAEASNAYFLLQTSNAKSVLLGALCLQSDFTFSGGGQLRFGASNDLSMAWVSANEWYWQFNTPAVTQVRWSTDIADNIIFKSINFGGGSSQLRIGFDKFAFGQTGSVGNQVGIFVAPARATGIAGGWADFLLTQAGNLTIDHNMSDVSAWVINPISLTSGAGSITGYITTFNVGGMTTSLIGSAETSALRFQGRMMARGTLAFPSNSPTALAADANDYQGQGIGNNIREVVRVEASGADRTITGLDRQQTGDTVLIINVGSTYNVVLAHQNASSAAENRIISPTGANLTLGPDEYALLWHDDVTDRWRILPTNGF